MLAYKMKDLLVDYEYQGIKYTKPFCKIKGRNPEVIVTDVYPAPVNLGNLTATEAFDRYAPTSDPKCSKYWSETKPQPEPPRPLHWYEMDSVVPQQEQGNNPMNYNQTNAVATVIADTSEQDKRKYLSSRLGDIFYDRRADVDEMFGFGGIDHPKTAKEAMERIKAGKFTIDGSDDEKPRRYFYFDEAFSWRDPSVKQDEAGRDAALSELNDFRDGLLDIVKVKSLDEAFDTLKALQEWQPTGKAN